MRFFRKPEEVDAIQLSELVNIGGVQGEAGDYLVHHKSGSLMVVKKEAFEDNYTSEQEILSNFNQNVFMKVEEIEKVRPGVFSNIKPEPDEKELERIKARLKAEENQTSELCCFTCGEDVKASQVDSERNCPKCAKPKPAATPNKNAVVGVCEECGSPAFPEAMKDGVCKACQRMEAKAEER
jgi:hypothetical protein